MSTIPDNGYGILGAQASSLSLAPVSTDDSHMFLRWYEHPEYSQHRLGGPVVAGVGPGLRPQNFSFSARNSAFQIFRFSARNWAIICSFWFKSPSSQIFSPGCGPGLNYMMTCSGSPASTDTWCRHPAEYHTHRLLSCRNPRGWTVPGGHLQVLASGGVLSESFGCDGTALAWAMTERGPRTYHCKANAATPCWGYASTLDQIGHYPVQFDVVHWAKKTSAHI